MNELKETASGISCDRIKSRLADLNHIIKEAQKKKECFQKKKECLEYILENFFANHVKVEADNK